MNIKFLETFVLAAQLGSFSQTAERMHTTLAAISQRIQTLEREWGVQLFIREPRHIRLSPKGREALMLAEQLIRTTKRLELFMRDGASYRGRVRLGVIDTAAHVLLSGFLQEMHRRLPMVEVDLYADTSRNILERLAHGDIELGIFLESPLPVGMRCHSLLNLACHWIARPNLVQEEGKISLEDLARYPILSFAQGSAPHRQIEALFEPIGGPRRMYCGTSLATMLKLARDGLGVSVLPAALLQDELFTGQMKLIQADGALPTLRIQIAYLEQADDALLDALVQIGLDVSREYCRNALPHLAWRD
ncbi:MAG: LysR family transcriptional regulator [Hydrogenophaga sp.]|nr:LysR family transcriptional regulator [Hydrogenophaga sp.]